MMINKFNHFTQAILYNSSKMTVVTVDKLIEYQLFQCFDI